MSEHDPSQDQLRDRMERAVGDLRSPDVLSPAIVLGRRRRARRRVGYAAGGVAAVAVLAVAIPALADGPGARRDGVSAADPAPTTPVTPSSSTPSPDGDPCDGSAEGWWSKPSSEVKADLTDLLPEGVVTGITNDEWPGTWAGNLVADGDADFASLTLLPPPGAPGGRHSLRESPEEAACIGSSNNPMQPIKPCRELSGYQTCREIRSGDDTLIGVVTERVEQTIENGHEQPTDLSYVLATVVGPQGGHVELWVGEGTRADRPGTVHDPDDGPALTVAQAQAIVTDPVWTR